MDPGSFAPALRGASQLFGRRVIQSSWCLARYVAFHSGGGFVLWTIFVILLILWLLGLVSSYTLGGFIHILLVLALVVLLINIISGRRTAL